MARESRYFFLCRLECCYVAGLFKNLHFFLKGKYRALTFSHLQGGIHSGALPVFLSACLVMGVAQQFTIGLVLALEEFLACEINGFYELAVS